MTAARPDRRTVLRGLGAAGVGAMAGWAIGADSGEAATTPDIEAATRTDIEAAAKPNIIVIVIDDLARLELGCYGNTFN